MPSVRGPLAGGVLLLAVVAARADDAAKVAFFESKIRPVLVEHCYKCHSEDAAKAKKLRGGLKLDTRAGWQDGGDTGPAVVPGKADAGTLVKSLRYDGDLHMPPAGKLPANVVADFERWVTDGAVDPRTSDAKKPAAGVDVERGRTFWAFQKPTPQTVPTIANPKVEPRTAIDAFVHAKWDEHRLTPAPLADPRTLVRRLSLDLTGLPPTPEDVEAFAADPSPPAWDKLVEKYIASPHHGERWGRHWLDVARYAEDQAHTFAVTPKTNAFLYRDWVIRALNDDMPFDRFVKLQLAGDLMPASGDDKFTRLAGLGLMGLGAEYYKNTAREQAIAEELDDRVDTLTRGFLGLTVACARCHDHKFDPIPTKDYYAVAGVFHGTNLTSVPLAPADEIARYDAAQAKVKAAEADVTAFLGEHAKRAVGDAAGRTREYLVAAWAVRTQSAKASAVAENANLNRPILDRWVKFLDPARAQATTLPAFAAWHALKPDATPEAVASAADAIAKKLAALAPPADWPVTPAARRGADPLTRAVFLDNTAPLLLAPADVEKAHLPGSAKPRLDELRAAVEKRKKESPPVPLAAHVVSGQGQAMPVYIRGNPATKGDVVPKGFVRVLLPADAKPPTDFTRLDLANAIASADNPLTARVIVNRVWAWHFGRGLVGTPSNFGALGDRPTHPELLDHLAIEFMRNGWSLKWLHRQIVTSTVYKLASRPDPANAADAANLYLWRGARKRLDVEAWRDSLLAVSGDLDTTIGGPTFDLNDASVRRRTVYAKVSRHNLAGLLRLFDFPDPNVTADKRTSTTVPQQQLFALNSAFLAARATAFAARVQAAGETDAERVTAAYRLAFGRKPEPAEAELGVRFVALPATPGDGLTRWQQYAQALLASNELMFVD